jgi:predicted nucleic acid-binding protein
MKAKTVVADASTLIGLSRIEQLVLLRDLYGEIVIPQSVYDEVVTESKHGSERIKAAKYLKVEKVSDSKGVELLLGYLGKGEAEALTLSKEKKADLILIDEKKARKAARRAGFEVIGVLGLLLAAKNKGLIPTVRPFIEELSNQGFRLSKKVTERALKEAKE